MKVNPELRNQMTNEFSTTGFSDEKSIGNFFNYLIKAGIPDS